MKAQRFFYAMLLLTVFSFNSYGNQDWQLEKSEQGVDVFTRSSKASDFKEFKAITVIAADPETVFKVITEPSRLTHWMANTIYVEVLNNSSGKQSAYIVNKVPFPLQNRDGVFDYQVDRKQLNSIRINVTSGDPNTKANNKYVRIASAKGHWLIDKTKLGSRVTYQMLLDPGGSVPSWIANSQVVSVPFDTLVNLQKEVATQVKQLFLLVIFCCSAKQGKVRQNAKQKISCNSLYLNKYLR